MGSYLFFILPQQKISYRIPKKARVIFWLNGLFAFTIPFSLLFWGEKSVSAGLAGVLNGTVPLWAFILGAIFTPGREPIVFKKVSGLILGLVGVICIFLPKLAGELGVDPSLWGGFAITMMALSYATSSLINREIFSNYKQMHPFTNLFHQLVAGLVGLIILALMFEGIPDVNLWRPYSTVIWASLYLGVGSTCIAFMCFYHLIKVWGPIQATTVTYLVPAITLLFDVLLNHTVLKMNELLGLILVTLGVIILNLQIPNALRKIKKN
ncbi:MAG: DMT family transporter [Bacteriovoracaceae bacterium]|nr:DMT family transporter [Bacteriovoracaceae bacterium]